MNAIRAARKAKGYTQTQVAKMAGVSQGAVAQWETGRAHPSIATIPALADALGVTVEEIVRGAANDRSAIG